MATLTETIMRELLDSVDDADGLWSVLKKRSRSNGSALGRTGSSEIIACSSSADGLFRLVHSRSLVTGNKGP